MNRAGRHSFTSFSIAVKRPGWVAAASGARGCAVPTSASPTATPMRCKPKSNARTVPAGLRRACSGMSRLVGEPRVVQPEQLHRRGQALVGRKVEQDRVLRLDGQRRVLLARVLDL